MRAKTLYLGLVGAFLASACTHSIHSVHIGGFEPYAEFSKGKLIEARSEQFAVLGFVYDTDYVDKAARSLEERCAGGEIRNVTTQFSTSHGFLSWTNKILMKGYCFN